MKNKKTELILIIILFINISVNANNKINVFFNMSVDYSVASNDSAIGNVDLDSLLCAYIHNAKYSIDCCVYNFNDFKVSDSLIRAHNRGVNIRFITDNENMNYVIDDLINSGISVINDGFSFLYNGGYHMHNKFFIFDYRDSSSYTDDLVWTGSWNVTYWGLIYSAENVVTIHDHNVSKAYTDEFEEMWGSNNNIPNYFNSKFSHYKTDNTQHQFIVDGDSIEVYFSPSDNFKENLRDKIETTDYESYFCVFYFSHQDISDALKYVWNGIGHSDSSNIRGVFDDSCWINNYNSEARDMAGISGSGNPWYPPLDTTSVIVRDNVENYGLLHHKYLLIDAEHPESNPWIITGSANWSYWGDNYNDENIIFIQSDLIVNQFFQEWIARYKEAGGEFSGIDNKNYNGSFALRLTNDVIVNKLIIYLYLNEYSNIPIIDVISLSGQKVASLILSNIGGGVYKAEWYGIGKYGKLPNGIYFLSLRQDNNIIKKVILIK